MDVCSIHYPIIQDIKTDLFYEIKSILLNFIIQHKNKEVWQFWKEGKDMFTTW